MKIHIKLQIRNVEKQIRVSIYEQDDGRWYAIRVRTNEDPVTPGALTILQNITREEAIALAEL